MSGLKSRGCPGQGPTNSVCGVRLGIGETPTSPLSTHVQLHLQVKSGLRVLLSSLHLFV